VRPPGSWSCWRLLIEGLRNAAIADRLVVSQRAAEHHAAAVRATLNALTRQEAARRAAELGTPERSLAGNRRPIVGMPLWFATRGRAILWP
jgi:hypothetical protein